jgi:uncharacterized membrane protein YraQ (UPF0718 family)
MATVTDRPTLNPIAQWIVWFVLGVGNALLFGIGGVILVVIFLALAVRVASRGDTVSALSGLLEDLFDPHRRRGAPVLDPEVPERPARRRFSAAYKATCGSSSSITTTS